MVNTIITTIITFLVSTILGWCLKTIKDYKNVCIKNKENENIQNIALLSLLQSNLTNIFFVYENIGEIPDYVYKNWLNMFAIYKKLGGNDFVDALNDKMKKWKINKTGVL